METLKVYASKGNLATNRQSSGNIPTMAGSLSNAMMNSVNMGSQQNLGFANNSTERLFDMAE